MPVTIPTTLRLKQLSSVRQRLIRLIQSVHFGRVALHITGGEPDPRQNWRVRRTVKLSGGEGAPRPTANTADFVLCKEQTTLLTALTQAPDGARVKIEVRHGLPSLVEIDHQDPGA